MTALLPHMGSFPKATRRFCQSKANIIVYHFNWEFLLASVRIVASVQLNIICMVSIFLLLFSVTHTKHIYDVAISFSRTALWLGAAPSFRTHLIRLAETRDIHLRKWSSILESKKEEESNPRAYRVLCQKNDS